MKYTYSQLKNTGKLILAGGLTALAMGCGTINSGRYQTIRVESEPAGAEIWFGENPGIRFGGYTPTNALASRKNSESILIEKKGYVKKYIPINSEFNNQSFKNFFLLPFFFIGGAVDLITGGAYELNPKTINITLQKAEPKPTPKKELNIKNDEETIKYLKMLKELKDSQTITEEEFNEKRKSLVDRL